MKNAEVQKRGVLVAISFLSIATFVVVFALLFARPSLARLTDDAFEEIVNEEITKNSQLRDLNNGIENKANEVRELEEKLDIYEKNIQSKLNETITLENHIAVLDEKIEETSTQIESSAIELDVLQLEVQALQEQIHVAEDDITIQKTELQKLVHELFYFEQKTPLEITFGNATFSDFFSDVQYTNTVQQQTQHVLDSLQRSKKQMKTKREEVKEKQQSVAAQKEEFESQQMQLEGEELYKQELLTQTEESKEQFEILLANAKKEQSQIEGEIAALEKKAQVRILDIRGEIQQRLDDENTENDDLSQEEQEILNGNVTFSWPISSRLITCGFYCEGYPFKNYIGNHTGMDIATPIGTSVAAAASGYVTRVQFDGTPSLGWIMLVHGDGLATVYMHLSCVSVSVDQYVRKGEQIGCSGGLPGTPGSGLSTGAHLHFEVRVDGIPTNPANYLP